MLLEGQTGPDLARPCVRTRIQSLVLSEGRGNPWEGFKQVAGGVCVM